MSIISPADFVLDNIACKNNQKSLIYFFPQPYLGFPCGSGGKESACNVGDLSSICGLGRSPGEGKGLPTPVFWLENSMDCIVHGVAETRVVHGLGASWKRISRHETE